MAKKIDISIVSPVYMAEHILEDLVNQLNDSLTELTSNYEIILVNDCSPDGSWETMKRLKVKYKHLKIATLSRNFGQHATIVAGLSLAKGEWIVVMDCDLQDQPKEITKLYNEAKQGFDVVLAKRESRQDSFLKKLSSKLFYKFFNYFSGVSINREIANFGMYHQKVVKEILRMGDKIVFFPLLVKWVGYKQTTVAVEHAPRAEGKSSYSYLNLFRLAFNTIVSFSDKPLRLFLNFGILVSIISFVSAVVVFIQTMLDLIEVSGYASIFISICFFSGLIITILSVIGIYLGKVFNQVKNRPLFIIDELHD